MTAVTSRSGELLLAGGPVESLDAYRARGGARGLARAMALAPPDVISEVTRARLRGRGGAGFAAGVK